MIIVKHLMTVSGHIPSCHHSPKCIQMFDYSDLLHKFVSTLESPIPVVLSSISQLIQGAPLVIKGGWETIFRVTDDFYSSDFTSHNNISRNNTSDKGW